MRIWRLNGWLRLWVLVGVLYVPVVVALAWMSWPRETDLRDRWTLAREGTNEKAVLSGFGQPMSRAEAERILAERRLRESRGEKADTREILQVSRAATRLGRSIEVPSTARSSRPGDTVSIFVPLDTEERMLAGAIQEEQEIAQKQDAVDERFEIELRQLPVQKIKLVAWAATGWAIPMATLYAFGWSIRWVARGFRAR